VDDPKPVSGVHLTRTEENRAEVDALAGLLGGVTGVGAVLRDLNRRGRAALPWGRAVVRAFTWDAEDRRTPRWYPQGKGHIPTADSVHHFDFSCT
jgi:hypothetical protein